MAGQITPLKVPVGKGLTTLVCDVTAQKDRPGWVGTREKKEVTVWAGGAWGLSLRGILKEKARVWRLMDQVLLGKKPPKGYKERKAQT